MGFFDELKKEISQAVTELVSDEEMLQEEELFARQNVMEQEEDDEIEYLDEDDYIETEDDYVVEKEDLGVVVDDYASDDYVNTLDIDIADLVQSYSKELNGETDFDYENEPLMDEPMYGNHYEQELEDDVMVNTLDDGFDESNPYADMPQHSYYDEAEAMPQYDVETMIMMQSEENKLMEEDNMKDYKRVILKLSGEALANTSGKGYNDEIIEDIARQVKELIAKGMDIGIVIGGGNYWRGRSSESIDRPKADQIGMLATVMNCIYVSEIFRSNGIMTNILTPFECGSFTKLFSKDRANKYFAKGMVVFFAGGTGHPYFSTDTGVALRAIEMDADAILLAKAIDGVYDSDPKSNPNAVKYDTISIDEVVAKKLGVIDMTASVMCMENKVPLLVFGLNEKNSIVNALTGNFTGTKVTI